MIVMNRRSRFAAALIAIAALLFSQLAVSAFACPGLGDMNAAMQAMASDDAAQVDANLCMRHCDEGAKALDAAKPVAALPPALAPVLRLVTIAAPRAPAVHVATASFAGPAPPFLRTTVLRI